MVKESFIIYTRFYKPIQKLSNEQLGRLFRALFEYNSTDEDISVDDDIEMAFGFFSNQMDIDNAKWLEKVEKLRANAKAGKSKQLPANASKSNQIGLVNDNVNVNVNVNDNVNVIDKPVAKATAPKFIKPTLSEVKTYAASMNYAGFNAEAFINFYESNGWRVGRNPMKDWRAAVRSWQSKDRLPIHQTTYNNLHPIGDFSNERSTI